MNEQADSISSVYINSRRDVAMEGEFGARKVTKPKVDEGFKSAIGQWIKRPSEAKIARLDNIRGGW